MCYVISRVNICSYVNLWMCKLGLTVNINRNSHNIENYTSKNLYICV